MLFRARHVAVRALLRCSAIPRRVHLSTSDSAPGTKAATRSSTSSVPTAAPTNAPSSAARNLLGSLVLPTANRRVSGDPKVLSSFLYWLAQRGADLRHVDVRPCTPNSGNWGVFAAKDCAPGEAVIRLPLSCTVGTNFDPHKAEAAAAELKTRAAAGKTKKDAATVAAPSLALAAAIGNDVAAQQSAQYEESFQTLMGLLPAELPELKLGLRLLAERCRPYEKHSRYAHETFAADMSGEITFLKECRVSLLTASGRTSAPCHCTFPGFQSFFRRCSSLSCSTRRCRCAPCVQRVSCCALVLTQLDVCFNARAGAGSSQASLHGAATTRASNQSALSALVL